MEIHTEDLDANLVLVKLAGRMDIAGTEAVDMKFTLAAGNVKKGVVVDLSGVEFLASIGMRTLVKNAKNQANKGGKIALFGAVAQVKETLETTGITEMIPLYDDMEAAKADVAAALGG